MTKNNLDFANLQKESSYKRADFLDRDEQKHELTQQINKIMFSEPIETTIYNYWGVRGTGKTWLLSDVYHECKETMVPEKVGKLPLLTVLYSYTAEVNLSDFVAQMLDGIEEQLPEEAQKEEKVRFTTVRQKLSLDTLVELLLNLLKTYILVLLFDDTHHLIQSEKWERLERFFLEPLVTTDRCFVVMAGRRKIPQWSRFEVRRRVKNPKETMLQQFNNQQTMALVEKLMKVKQDLSLFAWTAGNPLFTVGLAKEILDLAQKGKLDLAHNWPAKVKADLLNRYVENGLHYLLKSIDSDLVSVLRQVSIFRLFRRETIQYVLNRSGDRQKELPSTYYRALMTALEQETEFVWWDRDRRSYQLSAVIRILFNLKWRLHSEAEYVEQHQYAVALYEKWAMDYPPKSGDFVLELWFHLANIYYPQNKEDKKLLKTESKKWLSFCLKNLNQARRIELANRLKADEEMQHLLPEDILLSLQNTLFESANLDDYA